MSYHNRDDVEDMNIHKELAYIIKKKQKTLGITDVIGKMYVEQCFFKIKKVQKLSGLDSGFSEGYSKSLTERYRILHKVGSFHLGSIKEVICRSSSVVGLVRKMVNT